LGQDRRGLDNFDRSLTNDPPLPQPERRSNPDVGERCAWIEEADAHPAGLTGLQRLRKPKPYVMVTAVHDHDATEPAGRHWGNTAALAEGRKLNRCNNVGE